MRRNGRYWHVVGVTGVRQAALQRLTPGTLCSPLLPRLLGCRRTWVHCGAYALHVAALVHCLLATTVERRHMLPVLLATALATACDLTLVGFHVTNHVWMLVCLGLGTTPADARFGCKVVLVSLWAGNGVAKMGPWWPWVLPGIV